MYIKDMQNGTVRKYGSDHHDSLQISDDGRTLSYENLQNGDGSRYGDYRFVTDKDGFIPSEDEVLIKHGAEAYFNIGGFGDLEHDINHLIEEYSDTLDRMEQDRRADAPSIGMTNALLTGKIGVYAKVISDLKGLVWAESEENDV